MTVKIAINGFGRIGRLETEGLQSVVQRLAQERSFLDTLFQTIEDGVLVTDQEGQVVFLNQAAGRLIGYPTENALGQPLKRLLPELERDLHHPIDPGNTLLREMRDGYGVWTFGRA